MDTAKRNTINFMNRLGLFIVALLVARGASSLIMSMKAKTPSIVLFEWC